MTFKRWFILSAIVFFVAVIIGMITVPNELPQELLDVIPEDIINLTPFALFIFIILKNCLAVLVSFILSPLLLVFPFYSLFFNGWFFGAVAAIYLRENSFFELMAGILPHGIIEIPAYLIAQAAALSFGAAVILAIFKKERRPQVVPGFKQNVRYLIVAILLLIPAAAIEAFVTPSLLSWFNS